MTQNGAKYNRAGAEIPRQEAKLRKRTFYRDNWNPDKTWEVLNLVRGFYLRQYIKGVQFGRGIRTTKKYISSIGIFGFEKLSEIEEAKNEDKGL